MNLINKEYLKKSAGNLVAFLAFSLMFGAILTRNSDFVLVFLGLLVPYFFMWPFGRANVSIYLISINYTMAISFICLLTSIAYTLWLPSNAKHYYGLVAPENYIATVCCILPFIALFIHMLRSGCKTLDEISIPFTETHKKINLSTGEYYMNQKINMLKDITKKSIYDSKAEKFIDRHANLIYRSIMFVSGIGPAIPILISRTSGQQAVEYFFLLSTAYMAWLYSYFLPISIQATRSVIYIQKKHNIKLKLAYKKDVIIV